MSANILERESLLRDPAWAEARAFFGAEFGDGAHWPLWTAKKAEPVRLNGRVDPDAAALALSLTRGDDASLLALLGLSLSIMFMRYCQRDSLLVWFAPLKGQAHPWPLNFGQGQGSFADALVEVRKRMLRALALSDFPAGLLVDESRGRPDLLCALAGFQESASAAPADASMSVTLVREAGGGLALDIAYVPGSVPSPLGDRLAAHLSELWRQTCADPKSAGLDPDFVPAAEREEILRGASRMGDKSDWAFPDRSIPELFMDSVAAFPDRIAVEAEGRSLSYRELEARTSALGRAVRAVVAREGAPVAVLCDRSIETVVAVMGILRSGHPYVPIDPTHPVQRQYYIAADAKVAAIVSSRAMGERALEMSLKSGGAPCLVADDATADAGGAGRAEFPRIDPASPAYIIYTSGTTGQPKGSVLTHRNVVRLLKPDSTLFDFTERDAWSLFHSFCFDLSVWEMFGALFFGGRIVIASEDERKDPRRFVAMLAERGVTKVTQTPTAFYQLARAAVAAGTPLPALRMIVFGGEALKTPLLEPFARAYPHTRLINMYGITETTVHVTFKELGLEEILADSTSVGVAIPTLRVYILDKKLRVQPRGAQGELCVEGLGLADGYLNRPDLTAQRFVANPHSGQRMYRSGDVARWNADDELEFLGRSDAQVKIHGYRVETSEIEVAMSRHGSVTLAACAARTDKSGEVYLCAWYCASRSVAPSEMRGHLLDILPSYMLPTRLVQLESFPLNANGKTDYRALPDPPENAQRKGAAPADELELSIASAWKDVLGAEDLGVEDDFYELGGDSIKAMQICARLGESGLALDVKEIFKNPTIAGLKPFVRPLSRVAPQEPAEGSTGLSPIQRWFFSLGEPGAGWNNQSVSMFMPGGFDRAALKDAFAAVFARHDALRFAFTRSGGDWLASYLPREAPEIRVFGAGGNERDALLAAGSELDAEFDLSSETLLRAGLVPAKEGDYLIMVAHHLVMDTVSWQIILEDLGSAYFRLAQGAPLRFPLKTDSYAAWVSWLGGPALEAAMADLGHWAGVASSAGPFLSPAEHGRREDARETGFSLSAEETNLLMTRAWKAYYCEPRDILVAALGMAAATLFDSPSVTVDMEGHGRETPAEVVNVSRTVGWFTSIYPLRVAAAPGSVAEAIKAGKESLRRVPSSGLSWGALKYLARRPELARPSSDILFNFHGEVDGGERNGMLRIADHAPGALRSPRGLLAYGIELNMLIRGGVLKAEITWDSTRVPEVRIAAFAERYRELIGEFVSHCLALPEPVHTPSDFGLDSDMDESDMSALLRVVDDL